MSVEGLQVKHLSREEILSQKVIEPVREEGQYKVWEDDSYFDFASNFPCPICRQSVALFNNTQGTMCPCENCRLRGYHTFRLKKNTRFIRWLLSKIATWDSVSVISDEVGIDNKR